MEHRILRKIKPLSDESYSDILVLMDMSSTSVTIKVIMSAPTPLASNNNNVLISNSHLKEIILTIIVLMPIMTVIQVLTLIFKF
jgi:hypothetical protein